MTTSQIHNACFEFHTYQRADQLEQTELGFGFCPRAPFAVHPSPSKYGGHQEASNGKSDRVFDEPESRTRTAFQRDRDRIIHSNAFRRLKHKTQVFISDEGDHYRTRLTHSIEVAQIARALARAFRLDEDLTEALALAHDFGHTPFGHAGERALNACMKGYGGFDHNLQSLRVVHLLEQRYPAFDGLNLSWDTLEGLAKHNGPVPEPLAEQIRQLTPGFDLKLDGYASLEAQAAAIADDIAYNTHDIDDGLRSGLLHLDDLYAVPLLASILAEISETYPELEAHYQQHELTRRLITRMVEDVIQQTQLKLDDIKPQSVDDVRNAGQIIISFSPSFAKCERELKTFLFANLYRHPDLMDQMKNAEKIIADLFDTYFANFDELPEAFRCRFIEDSAKASNSSKARVVADYLAGMTDLFARSEHHRITGTYAL
ncbi:MAG: deoxyguanosinetriphosphate triphosphohydrolase [Rhizobiales bacterium]|nr:deoxyguanosinetriphosphate triphosphohydrolase [Hyphomicrobiales bacterium]